VDANFGQGLMEACQSALLLPYRPRNQLLLELPARSRRKRDKRRRVQIGCSPEYWRRWNLTLIAALYAAPIPPARTRRTA
jgi:hypothetical protein